MRLIAILFLICGVGLAGGAIYYANEHFLELQANSAQEGPEMTRIVAVKERLEYGDRIDYERAQEVLTMMTYPVDSVPEGAFTSSEDLLGPDKDEVRIVLRTIEPNELLLKSKVTGFGEGLRLQVAPGMRPVTIPVDAVSGGIGFIVPGDYVDIQWTRRTNGGLISTILLQAIKVIAVDQSHSNQSSGPRQARTVTVEVKPTDAQKLFLAMDAGSLRLLARGAGDMPVAATSPNSESPAPAAPANGGTAAPVNPAPARPAVQRPEDTIIDLSDLPGAPKPAPAPAPAPAPEPVIIVKEPEVVQPLLPGGKPVPKR